MSEKTRTSDDGDSAYDLQMGLFILDLQQKMGKDR